jgi:S1-C subfamily serine protease
VRALTRVAAILVLAVLALGPALGEGGPEAPPTFAPVVAALAPAVVTIALHDPGVPGERGPAGDNGEIDEDGTLGSGLIIDPRGVVVTNAHVASGTRPLEVVTHDGRRYRPTRVAIDRRSDLAVLIIGDGSITFPHARLADSDRVQVGDWVVAIGTPLGLRTTVTAGVISARARDSAGPAAPDYLQTSAVMHEGSSGGPLVDVHGDVVGINTVLAFEAAGVAFTIPSNTVRTIAAQLAATGRVSRPWLGVLTQALTPELARALKLGTSPGLLVADVALGSPAATAGLRSGDLLLALEAHRLLSRVDLARALEPARSGQTVTVEVRRRDGAVQMVSVTLAEERDETPTSLVTYRVPELGCEVRSVTPDLGVVVVRLSEPSGTGGLRPGDVVREMNHTPVRTVGDLARLADRLRAGEPVALLVQRGPVATWVALKAGRR